MKTTEPSSPVPAVTLQSAAAPVELTLEQLRFQVAATPDFRTTAELEPCTDFIGQDRARTALELGLDITGSGFALFVSGLTGTEKLETLRRWIAQHVAQVPTPGDWVYVHNFAHPDEPRAIPLAAGRGRQLKHFMNELVSRRLRDLATGLKAFVASGEAGASRTPDNGADQSRAERVEALHGSLIGPQNP